MTSTLDKLKKHYPEQAEKVLGKPEPKEPIVPVEPVVPEPKTGDDK